MASIMLLLRAVMPKGIAALLLFMGIEPLLSIVCSPPTYASLRGGGHPLPVIVADWLPRYPSRSKCAEAYLKM